jgi:hypothetical protein
MAAFAASPIPYRSFGDAPTDPTPVEQVISHVVPAEAQAEAGKAVVFPLLLAALPEVSQSAMPQPPAVKDTTPAKLPMPSPMSHEASPSIDARAPEVPSAKTPDVVSSLPPAQFSLPVNQVSWTRKPKPYVASRKVDESAATPLATMFRILQAESPSRQERTVSNSELQNMFRRL